MKFTIVNEFKYVKKENKNINLVHRYVTVKKKCHDYYKQ